VHLEKEVTKVDPAENLAMIANDSIRRPRQAGQRSSSTTLSTIRRTYRDDPGYAIRCVRNGGRGRAPRT